MKLFSKTQQMVPKISLHFFLNIVLLHKLAPWIFFESPGGWDFDGRVKV